MSPRMGWAFAVVACIACHNDSLASIECVAGEKAPCECARGQGERSCLASRAWGLCACPPASTPPPPPIPDVVAPAPRCGDGVAGPGEACDGEDLKGAACAEGGVLRCDRNCQFDRAGCARCGDGAVSGDELCDGADLRGASCAAMGVGGTLRCGADCRLDFSSCSVCGNGRAEDGEDCDGADLRGRACTSLGFSGGSLRCSACRLDTAACDRGRCGDGVVQAGESCDDGVADGREGRCQPGCGSCWPARGTVPCEVPPRCAPGQSPVQPGWWGCFWNHEFNPGYMAEWVASAVPERNTQWWDPRYLVFARSEPTLDHTPAGRGWFPVAACLENDPLYFTAAFRATLHAAQTDTYRVVLGSDDDGWLYVDGALVADDHGVHGLEFVEATVRLTAGEHEARVWFAERHPSESALILRFVKADGTTDPRVTFTHRACTP